MNILDPIAEFPPEVASAVTWPVGDRRPDGLRMLVELCAFCGDTGALTADFASEWADQAASELRPRVLACHSAGQSLETVWRFAPDPPKEWRLPEQAAGIVIQAFTSRLGIETELLLVKDVPVLRVEDLDKDRVLSPLDGCLQPLDVEEVVPIRPRRLVSVLLSQVLEDHGPATLRRSPRRALNAAKLAAFLSPSAVANWVSVAEASVAAGEPGRAYTIAGRLRGQPGCEAVAKVLRAAEADLAQRN